MGSVVLGEGVAERVEADVKGFLGRAKWYAERGELGRSSGGGRKIKLRGQEYLIGGGISCMDLRDQERLLSSKH